MEFNPDDYAEMKARWDHHTGGSFLYHCETLINAPSEPKRLEHYTKQQLNTYIQTSLSPVPTIRSNLFGPYVKLVRQLPFPFHAYSITHDGLLYSNAHLSVDNEYKLAQTAWVPTYNVLPTKTDTEFTVARLKDFYGRDHSFLVHRLVASMFLPNPTGLTHVWHNNQYTVDNHVQNLMYVVNWNSERERTEKPYWR